MSFQRRVSNEPNSESDGIVVLLNNLRPKRLSGRANPAGPETIKLNPLKASQLNCERTEISLSAVNRGVCYLSELDCIISL